MHHWMSVEARLRQLSGKTATSNGTRSRASARTLLAAKEGTCAVSCIARLRAPPTTFTSATPGAFIPPFTEPGWIIDLQQAIGS